MVIGVEKGWSVRYGIAFYGVLWPKIEIILEN